jgi:pimeloyl-ACP methyl ester carboxylesterase
MVKSEGLANNHEMSLGLPVRTVQELAGDLYSGLGFASKRSFALREDGEPQPRFPFTRVKRAEVFVHRKLRNLANSVDKIVSRFGHLGEGRIFRDLIDQHRPHKGIEYYRNLDRFDQQFQVLQEREINMGDVGDMKMRYSRVAIDSLRKDPSNVDKLPIFIIPAYAGDIYGVEPLARAYALEGNEVYTLPAPEAFLGTTTEKFANAVEDLQSPADNVNFEPHTTYYEKAIKTIMSERGIESGSIRLVGYSTGGAITFELLDRTDFLVHDALIIAPASSIRQNIVTFGLGLKHELSGITDFMKPINSAITIDRPSMDPGELKRRNRIARVQLKKVRSKSHAYKNAKTTSRKIRILSGSEDRVTKSDQALDEMARHNPQIEVVRAKNLTHVGPLYDAERLIPALEKMNNTDTSNSSKRKFIYIDGEIHNDD